MGMVLMREAGAAAVGAADGLLYPGGAPSIGLPLGITLVEIGGLAAGLLLPEPIATGVLNGSLALIGSRVGHAAAPAVHAMLDGSYSAPELSPETAYIGPTWSTARRSLQATNVASNQYQFI